MTGKDSDAVDLSDKNLGKIPEDVLVNGDGIWILDLSRNEATFRHSLRNVIEPANCALSNIPDELCNLKKLQILYLHGNNFSGGLNPAIGRLGRLKVLDLCDCKLPSLPDSIGDLEQLENLNLHGNNFSGDLNPAIGRLGRLKVLNLRDCNLATVPDSIGDLEQLEHLKLCDNDFSGGLNPALGRLGRLKVLDLRDCNLATLPDSVGDLEQLEDLKLTDNNFSKGLNAALGRLGRLQLLYLDMCNLSSLPDSIGDLEQLENLDLSRNDFSGGLNPALGRLGRLQKLYLSSCKLASLPDWIGNLKLLEELSLMGNKFSRGLNPALGQLQRLYALDLTYCKLKNLPEWIGDLEQMEVLLLGIDNLNLEIINELSFGDSENAVALWIFLFDHYLCLRNLDKRTLNDIQSRRNNFSRGLNEAVGKLHRLVGLFIDSCKMTHLPEAVRHLKELRFLSVKNNKLEDYPRCTLHLKKLLSFDISNDEAFSKHGNRVKSLPVELAHTSLSSLKLDGNPITEPPKEIFSQGIEAIKSFLRAVIPGGQLMHADTINMIGDTGAGKSSVAQSLIAMSPKATAEADRTHVLQQCRLNIEEQSVIINDFGGHEIYHSMLPIFLPTNGLLVLVYNMTDGDQEQKVMKWMLMALAKCKHIRMIIVGTHADLIATSEQCSALEKQMLKFSRKIIQDAVKEVDSHINRLKCQRKNGDVQNKLRNLRVLLESLASAAAPVVTLSCCKSNDGLSRLRDVVAKSLRPPETLPVRWCRAMNDILQLNADRLCITIEEVKRICGAHFTEDDDKHALATILRYLARTSQIIWLENHPLLRDYIFHIPQKIIDACKRIIHHDNVAPSLLSHYDAELRDYNKGILLEPLLLELLSAPTENFHLGNEQSASQDPRLLSGEVISGFLQHFNLISYVRTDVVKGKQFIVPCKLTVTESQERLKDIEKRGSACFNRVSVRLTFIGSIIPLSLFETSLSSMLTVAGELSRHLVWPDVWKDGAIISNDGVIFCTKRVDNVIVLSAFSETSESSPWTLLHPILKRLSDYIMASWHGAPPTCAIVCPWCVRYGQHDAQVKGIDVDLPTLVAEKRRSKERLTCRTCLKAVPHSLCFPTREAGVFITDERELKKFFRDASTPTPPVWHNVNWAVVSDQHAYETLQRSHYELTCKLNCKEVTAILFQNGIVIENDMNLIQKKEVQSSMDARDYLLEIVRKKDKPGFKVFADALYVTRQRNLYEQVMSNLRAIVPQAFEIERGASSVRT